MTNSHASVTPTSVKTLTLTYLALLLLLGLTWAIAFVNLGAFSVPITFSVAFLKTVLIVLIFMEIRFARDLVRTSVWVGVVWLSILIGLSLTDYLTRNWFVVPGK